MKYTKTILIIVILSFFVGTMALAQNNISSTSALPDAGITPDSPFYFLKTWKESIQTFFAFGAENKAKQFLHLSEVRLAEYQKMAEKGKTDIAQKTLEKYEKQLNFALEKINQLKNTGNNIDLIKEKLQQTVSNQLTVLQQNLANAPEAARKGLENAIENVQKALQKKAENNEGASVDKKTGICKNSCGDKTCQEIVCQGTDCPCAETKDSCPQDCNKIDNTETNQTEENPELIGGQKDEYGCLVAAGYSWCASKNKCLRTWEETCQTESLSPNDAFAKCLAEAGAKMYGALWCSHCVNQKSLFGDSVKYINYNECTTPEGEQVCRDKGIEAYPTWIFQNGEKFLGELTLEQLSQKTGCALPQ